MQGDLVLDLGAVIAEIGPERDMPGAGCAGQQIGLMEEGRCDRRHPRHPAQRGVLEMIERGKLIGELPPRRCVEVNRHSAIPVVPRHQKDMRPVARAKVSAFSGSASCDLGG